jgi:hypothetical protein
MDGADRCGRQRTAVLFEAFLGEVSKQGRCCGTAYGEDRSHIAERAALIMEGHEPGPSVAASYNVTGTERILW